MRTKGRRRSCSQKQKRKAAVVEDQGALQVQAGKGAEHLVAADKEAEAEDRDQISEVGNPKTVVVVRYILNHDGRK